jgi:hypothetical protein
MKEVARDQEAMLPQLLLCSWRENGPWLPTITTSRGHADIDQIHLTNLFGHIAINAMANNAVRTCAWLRETVPELLNVVRGEAIEACIVSGHAGCLTVLTESKFDYDMPQRAVLAFLVIATADLKLISPILTYWHGGAFTDPAPLVEFLEYFATQFSRQLKLGHRLAARDKIAFIREQVLSLGYAAARHGHMDTLQWLRSQELPWPPNLCDGDYPAAFRKWVHKQAYMPCRHQVDWAFDYVAKRGDFSA